MPQRIEGRCKVIGCIEKREASRQYCLRHHAEWNAKEKVRKEQYQRKKRFEDPQEKERHAFYKSARWRALRAIHLADEPLCRECGEPARVVDHIERISIGGERYDQNNLQSLCDLCHNAKRSEESRGNKYQTKVELIIAPPMVGADKLAKQLAGEYDIIIDAEALKDVIRATDTHHRFWVPIVCEARDAMLRRLCRPNEIETAWWISSSVTDEEIRAHKLKGGSVILYFPTLTELRERSVAGEAKRSEEWIGRIRRWYEEKTQSTIPQIREQARKHSEVGEHESRR